MADFDDVIVAPATPWGRSALALVRLTGSGCHVVAARVARPRRALRTGRPIRVDLVDDDGPFDDGLAVFAEGPATATGEDTVEITCHGNPRIVERLLHACVDAGARLAEPGAFTRRGLAHGRLDLVRAEAVIQTIEATSDRGLAVARAGLDGSLSAVFTGLRERLVAAAAELEARMDEPGDGLTEQDDHTLVEDLRAVAAEAEALAATHRAGRHLVAGARVALVGTVNAGKSSLFNALLGRARALVHDTPGTTRDVVEARAHLDGVEVTLLDTAGERATDDPVEAAGLALASGLVDEADLVVVVLRARPEGVDAAEAAILARTAERPRVVVLNGVDRPHAAPDGAVIPTVAPEGLGLDALRRAIVGALVGELPGDAARVVASARQRDLLRVVAGAAVEAAEALQPAGPAVAADAVVGALEALDALTGADTREDVLDALFSRFCIGK